MKVTNVEPMPDDLRSQIVDSAQSALAALGLTPADPASKVVERIDQFVFDWQDGHRTTSNGDPLTDEDLPFSLGPLWGEQFVRDHAWSWVKVTFEDNSMAPGVASPDRAFVVYPIHFLIGCVQDPTVDVTLMLMWNMLEGGKITGTPANTMSNIMAQVHRIVPRRNPPPRETRGFWSRLTGK